MLLPQVDYSKWDNIDSDVDSSSDDGAPKKRVAPKKKAAPRSADEAAMLDFQSDVQSMMAGLQSLLLAGLAGGGMDDTPMFVQVGGDSDDDTPVRIVGGGPRSPQNQTVSPSKAARPAPTFETIVGNVETMGYELDTSAVGALLVLTNRDPAALFREGMDTAEWLLAQLVGVLNRAGESLKTKQAALLCVSNCARVRRKRHLVLEAMQALTDTFESHLLEKARGRAEFGTKDLSLHSVMFVALLRVSDYDLVSCKLLPGKGARRGAKRSGGRVTDCSVLGCTCSTQKANADLLD